MDIRGMQYDFKQKLNKIDSQLYDNLKIPEIDWKLNEGLDIYIKSIAQPRIFNHLGFETSQRSIDDISVLVENDIEIVSNEKDLLSYYTFNLPENYMFYISAYAELEKKNCKETRLARCHVKQHDDEHEESFFDKSSFEWKEVNISFFGSKVKVYSNKEFKVKKIYLNYIKKHAYIHNAQDYLNGTYRSIIDNTMLTGSQDCELPDHTHREIVDIAVLIATDNLHIPDYQIKQTKIKLNQLN